MLPMIDTMLPLRQVHLTVRHDLAEYEKELEYAPKKEDDTYKDDL